MNIRWLLIFLLALPSLATAKDELIPTERKTRDRQEGPPNPLYEVASDMEAVARRIRVEKTADTTQDRQKAIVEKLDLLIEAARQQSQQPPKSDQDQEKKQRQQQPKQQPKPDEAQQQKKEQEKKQAAEKKEQEAQRPGFGPGGKDGAKGELHTDAEEWGNLPPAIREQLLNVQGEGFPLKYRELLRRYYRELAKPRD